MPASTVNPKTAASHQPRLVFDYELMWLFGAVPPSLPLLGLFSAEPAARLRTSGFRHSFLVVVLTSPPDLLGCFLRDRHQRSKSE